MNSLLSNRNLYNTANLLKWTPRFGPCLSLLIIVDSQYATHLSKTDILLPPEVFFLVIVDGMTFKFQTSCIPGTDTLSVSAHRKAQH